MKKLLSCWSLLQLCLLVASQSKPEFIDPPEILNFWRSMIQTLSNIERTGQEGGINFAEAVRQGKVQKEIPSNVPFPCDVKGGRSPQVPDSVHRLRPGDIDVVASMGDSLGSGAGTLGTTVIHVGIENRGVTAAGGGQANWRKFLTLPNILKEFNPKLIGYAIGDSMVSQRDISQYNIAVSGALSQDVPIITQFLVESLKNDPRVDIKKDWKFVSVMIGANNICSDICAMPDPQSVLKIHKENMLEMLRTLRDNLPRTFVNLQLLPHFEQLVKSREGRDSILCYLGTTLECTCLFALKYRKRRPEFYDILKRWIELDKEIAGYPEFNTNDFTISVQPTLTQPLPRASDGYADMTFLATDCFHISQKTNAQVANNMWNNLLEPFDNKTETWVPLFERFLCPTAEHPYLMTRENSYKNFA